MLHFPDSEKNFETVDLPHPGPPVRPNTFKIKTSCQ